ncbi:hypothetical protein QAD02_020548 [Eretmocerus hayati]|uniref:Uncharacterized protein n=1 Tax=Eretmocerus hayati TaxID=131215 RepID=A0ACC2PMU3_9HYME|nr:hypothetical protein QAD02_020548 [Eretmocerus hayati]
MDSNHHNMGPGVDVTVGSSSSLQSSNSINPKKRRRSNNIGVQTIQRNAVALDFIPPPLSGFGDTVIATNPFDDTPEALLQNSAQHIHGLQPHHLRNTQIQGMTTLLSPGMSSVISHVGGMGIKGCANESIAHVTNLSGANHSAVSNTNPVSLMHSTLSQAIVTSNKHVNMNHILNSQLVNTALSNSPNGMRHGIGSSIRNHVDLVNCTDSNLVINGAAIATTSNSANSSLNHSAPICNLIHLSRSNSNRSGSMKGIDSIATLPDATMGNNQVNQINPIQSQVISLRNMDPSSRNQPGNLGCSVANNLPMTSRKSCSQGAVTSVTTAHHGFQCPQPSGARVITEAGRIYPPDQPMVFNHQNPNAPPISPCGVCHKEVHANDQAILCESGCNFWFHRRCTGLSETAYDLLMHEVCAEWTCDRCMSSRNVTLVKFKP